MKFEASVVVFTKQGEEKHIFSYSPNFKVRNSIDALKAFFEFVYQVKDKFHSINKSNTQFFALGKVSENSLKEFTYLMSKINENLKLKLISPFEGCENIQGNLWRGNELLDRNEKDAIVQLKFEKKATGLPSHVHSSSDRVLLVSGGTGFFHPNFDNYSQFSKINMKSIPLITGNLLFFPRNFVHTFSTFNSEMEMFSYHLPFVELEDPLQYTITTEKWYPKNKTI